MGVLYALVAIVIILLAEFYHNDECRTQEYVWIIVEGFFSFFQQVLGGG